MSAVAAVVIGRNEGARLVRCLASLDGHADPVVYVDSGSTDGSAEMAAQTGARVVALDMTRPFTAARARNAGLADLAESGADFVQMIDGDCEMRADWIGAARRFLEAHPDVAAVSGRLRERFPEASRWNALADAEWARAPGESDAVGGIALVRRAALEAVGGYREDLIAGEEPEMCLRLRRAGWRIWHLSDEMAWHDSAMTRVSQWWRRSRRAGFAFAEGAWLHRAGAERYRRRETLRALLWGAVLPLVTLAGLLVTPLAALLLLLWPVQMLRLRWRGLSRDRAVFLTLARLPEALGVLDYHLSRLLRRRREIIEYK